MRLIKRYSNRKLYDTTTRTYITLEALAALVVDGAEDIKVVDNETEADITTVVLSQLLLERERSRRSLSSGLLSGLLRSGETLGRGLSSLTRPLVSGPGLVGMLEHEIERSLKFWLEVGQGSEEEVLRMIEGIIERRRKGRASPEAVRPAVAGLNLLRRRSLDDFENWSDPESESDNLNEDSKQKQNRKMEARSMSTTANEAAWISMGEGLRRRVTLDGEHLMFVEINYQPGAVVSPHRHTNEQASYILRGKIRFTLEGQSREVGAGETFLFPSNSNHEAVAIEETLVLDVFSPPREDFR